MILRAGIHGSGPNARWSAACMRPRTAPGRAAPPPSCELLAVADDDAAAAAAFAGEFGLPTVCADFEALLQTGIDFVILAGPMRQRAEQVRLAAEQGVHCLLHTPMAPSAAAADAMLERCEEAAVHLGVLVPHMGDPVFEQIRQMVAQGWSGGVVHVQSLQGSDELLRVPPTAGDPRLQHELATNPILQLASGHVHLAAWLTGRVPVSVTAQASRGFLPIACDGAVATVLARGNTTCTFAASHLCAADQLAIHGTDGHVRVAGDRISLCGRDEFAGPVFAYDDPGHELVLRREDLRAALDRERPALELHDRFARSIEEHDDFPCPAIQATDDLRLLDAIGRALASGRCETVS